MDTTPEHPKPKRPHKILVIGRGLGKKTWEELSERGLADNVVMWQRTEPDEPVKQSGTLRALDQANIILDGSASPSFSSIASGQEALAQEMKDADIVIVTAGLPRKPGEARHQLIEENSKVIDPIAEMAGKLAPNATYIVATNPVDAMAQRFKEKSGIAAENIAGLSGVLDSARFEQAIAINLNIDLSQIEPQPATIGQHGDAMVPLFSALKIRQPDGSMKNLSEYDPEVLNKIREDTVKGGAKMIELLGSSDRIAPAAALTKMTEAVVDAKWNGKESEGLYASVYDAKNDIFIGQKVKPTAEGFKPQPMPELSHQEDLLYQRAIEACQKDRNTMRNPPEQGQEEAKSPGVVRPISLMDRVKDMLHIGGHARSA